MWWKLQTREESSQEGPPNTENYYLVILIGPCGMHIDQNEPARPSCCLMRMQKCAWILIQKSSHRWVDSNTPIAKQPKLIWYLPSLLIQLKLTKVVIIIISEVWSIFGEVIINNDVLFEKERNKF